MELAGLKVVMDADFAAVFSGLAQANTMLQQFGANVKNALNGIPDLKGKFNFTSNGASQATQDARELARAQRELAAANLDAAKAARIARQEEDARNRTIAKEKDEYGQLVADNQKLVRTYYNAAAAIITQGDAAGISAAKLEELRLKAKAGQEQLQSIEAGAGRFQRNVGNYASGFNPLNNSLNQISRELPAFTNSVQTGFLAISNNIAPFADALAQVRKETALARAEMTRMRAAAEADALAKAEAAGATAAQAKAEAKLAGALAVATPEQLKAVNAARARIALLATTTGLTETQTIALRDQAVAQALANTQSGATPSVLGKLTSAIFSWQTALSVGITLLTVYGPKLFDMIKGTKGGTEALKEKKEAQQALLQIEKQANDAAGEQIANLKILQDTMTDGNVPLAKRQEAYRKAVEEYPSYLSKVKEDDALNGALAQTINNELIPAILAAARARANQKKIDALSSKSAGISEQLDEERKALQAIDKTKGYNGILEKYTKKSKERSVQLNQINAQTAKNVSDEQLLNQSMIKSLTASIAGKEKVQQDIQNEIEGYLIKNRGLSSKIGMIDPSSGTESKTKASLEKELHTVEDARHKLIKSNQIADAELLAGAATVKESLEKKISNYQAYIKDLATTKLNLSIDSPQINEAYGEMAKLVKEVDKLKAPAVLEGATFNGSKFIQLSKDVKLSVSSIATDFKRYDKAVVDGFKSQRLADYAANLEDIFTNLKKMIQDTLIETGVLIGEGIGNIIAGTGGIGDLFKGIGQLLGDQIIAFGKQLIEAGVLLATAKLAIKNLYLQPAAAIVAGIAAVALGATLKATLSKQAKGVGRTKFADGGVVYGPTNALVGEYSGARGNPEVIAPLDKLQSILKNTNQGRGSEVFIPSMRISGQDLLVVFKRAEKGFQR